MYCRKIELKPKKKNGQETKELKTKRYVWECFEELPKDPVTGKRRRMTARGKTKPEAKAKLEAKIRDVTEYGLTTDPTQSTITFEELAFEWLKTHKKNQKLSAYRSNSYHVKRFGKYISKIEVRNITKKTYQNVIDKMEEDGYSYNTIYSAHAVAKKIFNQAKIWDIIKSSPADMAILPKAQKTVEELENEKEIISQKYLEREELKTFLKITKLYGKPSDDIVFLLLAFTGMRVGELLALKWTDINFETKEFSITKTIFNIDGNKKDYQLLTPKTQTSIRKISFDEAISSLLKKHKATQNQQIMLNRSLWHDGNFVITRQDGYPMSPRFIQHRAKRLEKLMHEKTNVRKKIHAHIFRHTHTSMLTEEGVDIRAIMQRLGHSDSKTTLAVYTHITERLKTETADKLGNVFSEITNNFQ